MEWSGNRKKAMYQHRQSVYQSNIETHQKQNPPTNQMKLEEKTDQDSIKKVFSFFVSFFPLDIVTRRSEQDSKASKSSSVKQKSKKRKAGELVELRAVHNPPQ
jgi:hypothetical protein